MSRPLPAEFADALRATCHRRRHFGEPARFYAETSSTNDVAARLAEAGAPEGTIVIASSQTAGRGRLGRAWHSPPEAGLYVSIICRTAEVAPFLTLIAGVAVADGIRASTGLPVEMKWPNDVVFPTAALPGPRRKLAGILAEGSAADGIQYVVVGIGVNLRPGAFPADLAGRVTSIEAELGRPVCAGSLLGEILSAFAEHVQLVSSGRSGPLLARCRALTPCASGCAVEYETPAGRQHGTTAGIADDGALLVRCGDRIDRVIAGELIWK